MGSYDISNAKGFNVYIKMIKDMICPSDLFTFFALYCGGCFWINIFLEIMHQVKHCIGKILSALLIFNTIFIHPTKWREFIWVSSTIEMPNIFTRLLIRNKGILFIQQYNLVVTFEVWSEKKLLETSDASIDRL